MTPRHARMEWNGWTDGHGTGRDGRTPQHWPEESLEIEVGQPAGRMGYRPRDSRGLCGDALARAAGRRWAGTRVRGRWMPPGSSAEGRGSGSTALVCERGGGRTAESRRHTSHGRWEVIWATFSTGRVQISSNASDTRRIEFRRYPELEVFAIATRDSDSCLVPYC